MSDDIVTRLRDWSMRLYPMKYGACMEEAADEIERLRKELGIYQDLYATEIVKRVAGE